LSLFCVLAGGRNGGEDQNDVPIGFDDLIAKGFDLEGTRVLVSRHLGVRGAVFLLLEFATHRGGIVWGAGRLVRLRSEVVEIFELICTSNLQGSW
jgi:hypothetical protein